MRRRVIGAVAFALIPACVAIGIAHVTIELTMSVLTRGRWQRRPYNMR